ncbi:hypothetical protein CTI12_AA259850 [Artemisia annua]|uniref:Uncharacterized protein n=1 Tax=Artemisia annua TaxID=35608 RepID=A0A2U1NJ30_ARTAN|nr:hypothetical protein CTI12_AA259850 [Artemisia annua]
MMYKKKGGLRCYENFCCNGPLNLSSISVVEVLPMAHKIVALGCMRKVHERALWAKGLPWVRIRAETGGLDEVRERFTVAFDTTFKAVLQVKELRLDEVRERFTVAFDATFKAVLQKQEQKVKDSYIPQAPSVKSFLSSIPAPRNSGSLGAGLSGSVSGTGRRSILEGEVPGLSNLDKSKEKVSESQLRYDDREVANENVTLNADYANYDYSSYAGYENASVDNGAYANYDNANVDSAGYANYDHSSYGPVAPGNDGGYGSYSSYGPAAPSSEYGGYGQYESKWVDRSGGNNEVGPEVSAAEVVQSVARVPGKRGRNEIPTAVIEVSQDELMKNRPREDQVKATGIAFGPAYQRSKIAQYCVEDFFGKYSTKNIIGKSPPSRGFMIQFALSDNDEELCIERWNEFGWLNLNVYRLEA